MASAAVVALSCDELLKKGLPWLHVDQVRVLRGPGAIDVQHLQACLRQLAPHLAGKLVLDAAIAALLPPAMLERPTAPAETGSP